MAGSERILPANKIDTAIYVCTLVRVYLGKPFRKIDFRVREWFRWMGDVLKCTTPVSTRRKLDSLSKSEILISTRLQGHKLIVYSIIWAEPAKAQAEAWQHHANFMDHTGGPRPEAAAPLCSRSHWHGVAMPQPVLLLARPR